MVHLFVSQIYQGNQYCLRQQHFFKISILLPVLSIVQDSVPQGARLTRKMLNLITYNPASSEPEMVFISVYGYRTCAYLWVQACKKKKTVVTICQNCFRADKTHKMIARSFRNQTIPKWLISRWKTEAPRKPQWYDIMVSFLSF